MKYAESVDGDTPTTKRERNEEAGGTAPKPIWEYPLTSRYRVSNIE